jgi:hypothetical protein
VGVGRFQCEGTALYLHQEHYERHIATNALWLVCDKTTDLAREKLRSGTYVAVQGTVDARDRGFQRLYPATIRVRRIEALPTVESSP